MLKFVDTHCHPQYFIDDSNRQHSAADFLSQSFEHLNQMLMVAVNLNDFEILHSLALMDKRAHMTAGIHPSHAHEGLLNDLMSDLDMQGRVEQVVALGETGLDYYHSTEHKKQQLELFDYHLQLGYTLSKPIVVHTRSAAEDTLSLLKNHPKTKGVIHCFTESKEFAKAVLDLNWMISFSGIITFKNAADLRSVVQYVPDDLILAETDAPYLAPEPFRGKKNIPNYVQYVIELLASLKDKSLHQMAFIVERNYKKLLNINSKH
jgi:TatD DNase family protein